MSVLKIDNPGTQGIATTNTIALGTQTIATAAGTTNLTTASPYQTIFTGTTTQTVVLPPANTGIPQGVKYEVDNNSTGLVTVQTYGGATLWVLGPGTCLLIINTSISTAAGTWDNDYLGVNAISGKVINFLSNGNGGTAINDGNGNISCGPAITMNFLECHGHSFLSKVSGLGTAITSSNVNQNSIIPNQLIGALGMGVDRLRNHAVDGSRLCSVGRSGSFARALTEITRNRQTYPFARSGGMYLFTWGINDLGGNTVANLTLVNTCFSQCLTSIISKARSSAIYLAGNGAPWTFGTNFSAGPAANADWTSGASMHATVVDSAGTSTATFTIPFGYNGEPICFNLVGTQGAATGCIVTWGGTVAGTSGIIGTTTNLNSVSVDTHSAVPVRFTAATNGLSAANAGQTITVRVTTISGGDFALDGCWIEAKKPDPVIVMNVARCSCINVPFAMGDGVTTGVNTAFTSATANFVAATDAGVAIVETDAQGAFTPKTVSSVTNATTIVLSGNAAAAKTNIQFTLARIQNGYSSTQGGYYSTNTDFANATPASHAAADADVAAMNAAIGTVVSSFGDNMVQVADIDTALGAGDSVLPAGIYSFYETSGLHPNDYGNITCVGAIMSAIGKLDSTDPLVYGSIETVSSPAYLSGPVRNVINSGQVYMPEFGVYGATYTAVAGDVFAVPMFVTEPTLNFQNFYLEQINAPATAGSNIRFALYDDVNMTGYPQCIVREPTSGGAYAMGTTAGVKIPNSFSRAVGYGLYWLVLKIDSLGTTASQLRTIVGPSQYLPTWSTAGGAQTNMAWKLTGVAAGALPQGFPTGAALSSLAPCMGVQLVVL